jgi:hypothetical protein
LGTANSNGLLTLAGGQISARSAFRRHHLRRAAGTNTWSGSRSAAPRQSSPASSAAATEHQSGASPFPPSSAPARRWSRSTRFVASKRQALTVGNARGGCRARRRRWCARRAGHAGLFDHVFDDGGTQRRRRLHRRVACLACGLRRRPGACAARRGRSAGGRSQIKSAAPRFLEAVESKETPSGRGGLSMVICGFCSCPAPNRDDG